MMEVKIKDNNTMSPISKVDLLFLSTRIWPSEKKDEHRKIEQENRTVQENRTGK
jgi:hypothetical protein